MKPTNPEAGPSDTVPAMLTPGEAVIPASVAQDPDAKPVIRAMVEEGRKRNRQAEANGIPVNHPAAIGAADGYYGYQGGVMNVPKPLGAPPKYNVAKPDYSQYNKAELGTGDQMMLTNDKHRQSVANKEGDHAQKMQHEREKMHQQMKLAQMKADQDYANTMRKEGGKLKAKSDEAELDKHLSEYKQEALTASMEGLGLDSPPPPMDAPPGLADGTPEYGYDDLVRDNKAFGFHADLAQRGNQQSADYARLMEERQELGIHQGAGVPLGIQGGLSEAQQAERIAAMRAKSGMGFAGGTSQVAQQAAMINNLLASGMSMEDIKQYLGDEIGAIGAPSPQAAPAYDPAAVAPPPVPQQSPVQATMGASGVYGSGPSAAAQDLLGQIQGRADGGMIGDRDIIIDGQFYSEHVPEIQGFGMGEWLVRQTNPELAAQGDLAESFAAQEALTADTYAGDPAAMQESREHIPGLPVPEIGGWAPPEFVHEGGGPPPEPLADFSDAQVPDLNPGGGHNYVSAAIDAVSQGAGALGRATEGLGYFDALSDPLKALDPLHQVREQKALADATTAQLLEEQEQLKTAEAGLGATDAQLVQGDTEVIVNEDALNQDVNDPTTNTTPDAVNAAKGADPEEKKGWLAQLGQSFKTAFGQLANPDDLATAAIVYGANRLLGYDDAVAGEQALGFWKKGQEQRAASEAAAAKRQAEREDFQFQEQVKSGLDVQEQGIKSQRDHAEARDLEILKASLRQESDAAKAAGDFKKSSRSHFTAIGNDAFGPGGFAVDPEDRNKRFIAATPEAMSAEMSSWMEENGITDPQDDTATVVFQEAVRRAAEHGRFNPKQQVRSIKPFLQSAFMDKPTGLGRGAFGKYDEDTGEFRPMPVDRLNAMRTRLANQQVGAGVTGTNKDLVVNKRLAALGQAFKQLPQKDKALYDKLVAEGNKRKDETAFSLFVEHRLKKAQKK